MAERLPKVAFVIKIQDKGRGQNIVDPLNRHLLGPKPG